MAKEFVRNIKETKLRGKNIEPLYTNEQNDLLSDKEHAYIRNNDFYFPLTQAILDIASSNEDGKNPVKPKKNIDGKENSVTLDWDTKALGNNFVEQMPITLTVDNEFNQIKIGIDHDGLYRFIKPYFKSTKDITVHFNDEEKTISYRLDNQAFFERLVSHFKDGNGLDFVIDNEFKTVHYNLKEDKIKSIIFDTIEPKDDDITIEQQEGKLVIDLSDENRELINNNSLNIHEMKKAINSFTGLEVYQEVINKYLSPDIINVEKVTPEKFLEEINERFKEEFTFYELHIMYRGLTDENSIEPRNFVKPEKLLLFNYLNKNYVLNFTNSDNVNNLTKEDVFKYNKELKNLNVTQDEDHFVTQFNFDKPQDVLYDLYIINSLDKI